MSNALAVQASAYDGASMDVLERVVVAGDLGKLAPGDRVAYYRAVCQSIGLNPFTKPFDYIQLNGKLTLYATKSATDQVRSLRGVSIDSCERDLSDPDYATWLVTGHDRDGRVDTEIGSVPIKGLAGEAKANAIMKALTKGKRRLTLSLAGLGWLDETEVGSVPSAAPVQVDTETGEILAREVAARPVASLSDRVAARREAIEARTVTDAPAPSQEPGAGPEQVAPGHGTTAPEHVPGTGPGMDGEGADSAPAPSPEPAQCESMSDPAMPPVERCRLFAGHKGVHRAQGISWPNP